MKVNFPEYDKQQELKIERRKNALPAFLIIRGGVLNGLMAALGFAATGVYLLVNDNYKNIKHGDTLLEASLLVSICTLVIAMYSGKARLDKIKNIIEDIKGQADDYFTTPYFDWHCKNRLDFLTLRHIAKQNPGIFDKFIQNPNSIDNMRVAENILLGHLQSHPADAQKILDTFNSESIPPKLYRRANRYATRLQNAEKSH